MSPLTNKHETIKRICPKCRGYFPPGANFCPHDGHLLEDSGSSLDRDPFIDAIFDERYRIESRLGQGGMGVVYAARHIVIEKPVAIKVLRDEYCRDPGMVERFIREARAASRIGHPNIVDVTDFGRLDDGHIYFVMEYLDGKTLSRELKDHGTLPMWRVVDLSVQVCNALEAAHAKGIVHRDLKPENIFILNPREGPPSADETDQGERKDFVKLLDFGIAKINWGPGTRLTRAGSIFGTPQYMCPEQAAGEDGDHRGDIYGMGCIIYEMATGEVPFEAETFMGTLTKHMFEEPRPPCQLRPDLAIPKSFEAAVLKAIAKEPGDRFQTMAAMSAEIALCGSQVGPALQPQQPDGAAQTAEQLVDEDIEEDKPTIARVPPPPESLPQRPSRRIAPTEDVRSLRRPSRGLPIVAVSVAALLIAGVIALMTLREERVINLDAGVAQAVDVVRGTPTRADQHIADMASEKKLLSLTISSSPSRADVLVDNVRVGRTPCQVVVKPNTAIVVRKTGYKSVSRQLDDTVSQKLHLRLVRRRSTQIRFDGGPKREHIIDPFRKRNP